MQSSLGLYIEDNLIKYAKVSKNNENVKIESFGVKFYENIGNAIKQIVEETYSFKVPISINTTDEWYNEIEVFSLLKKADMENAIKTEFENICYSKELNKNIYEERHIYTNSYRGDDKVRTIHISVPKTALEQRKKQFSQYKIGAMVPISVSIAALTKKEKKGTSIVVNIEERTTITKITNNIVSGIEVLNVGSKDILEKINKKENSYSKAYEICKSSTIYTETDRDLQYEESEYLEDIMPTLFEIVSHVKNVVDESVEKIDNVYITGTGAIINNVDIYFQDYLRNVHCEILKPSFINNNSKINVKDYIEVNSAIAIGLQGLDKNNKTINFKGDSGADKVLSILNSNVGDVKTSDATRAIGDFFGKFTRQFDFLSITSLILLIVYFAGAYTLNAELTNKMNETDEAITRTNTRIAQMQEYNKKFKSQTTEYENLVKNIQSLSDANTEDKRFRNAIPNLLNNLMVVIPRNVQLVSIENNSDEHVTIVARSNTFQQIAYFKTKLNYEGILTNVVSDTGTSQDGYLTVTIEGDLP